MAVRPSPFAYRSKLPGQGPGRNGKGRSGSSAKLVELREVDHDLASTRGHGDRDLGVESIGEELFDANKGNAMMMNQLAWTIVDPDGGVKKPNLDLAMKAAEAASLAAFTLPCAATS